MSNDCRSMELQVAQQQSYLFLTSNQLLLYILYIYFNAHLYLLSFSKNVQVGEADTSVEQL